MTPQAEVALTAGREIRKNLRSTKGAAMFALFFLGGVVPSILQVLFTRVTTRAGVGIDDIPSEMLRKARLDALKAAYDGSEAIANYLVDCPTVIYFLFKGTLFFLPLLVLLVGFDQIAGEVQHRTIRYITGRAHRGSIVFGKAIGIWVVVSIMILVLHGTVWGFLLAKSDARAGEIFSWGLRIAGFCVAYAWAYAGITAFFSSIFRTPAVSLFVGAGLLFGMSLLRLILSIFDSTKNATWLFPPTYEDLLVSPDPTRALGGVALLLVWGLLCTLAASEVLRRRDV
jgi:ABC-type transport system involved in multi-copper enzyme maturation permease subunit